MKLIIGVLSTIENEYEECIKSIKKQDFKNFDIFEIKNQPNKEAHDQLYSHFMAHSDIYDLFVKIDADMVIETDDFFTKVVDIFKNNDRLDRLYVPVYDHFMNKNLGGVNIYRNSVKWVKNNEQFYVDRVDDKSTIREFKVWKLKKGEILIHHCPNPNNYQSFYFGYHRTMKAFQPGKFFARYLMSHWKTINDLLARYEQAGEKKLYWSLLGANYVLETKSNITELSNKDETLKKTFESYIGLKEDKKMLKNICDHSKINYKISYTYLFVRFRIYSLINRVKEW